jgi:hypothetical protein
MEPIKFTHIIEWDADLKLYQCRSGMCSFTIDKADLEAAGYTHRAEGVILFKHWGMYIRKEVLDVEGLGQERILTTGSECDRGDGVYGEVCEES